MSETAVYRNSYEAEYAKMGRDINAIRERLRNYEDDAKGNEWQQVWLDLQRVDRVLSAARGLMKYLNEEYDTDECCERCDHFSCSRKRLTKRHTKWFLEAITE
jgi:hypothetical protein